MHVGIVQARCSSYFFFICYVPSSYAEDSTRATIRPYSAMASAKIIIKMSPTYSLSCLPEHLIPASPAMPMDIPDARPHSPQQRPAAKSLKPMFGV